MKDKGCIVVPYRDRFEHLSQFVPHYRSLTNLPIFVIEQADDKPFNRGKLCNVWFREYGFEYSHFIFHDVDMLAFPQDFDYSPSDCVTQLATKAEQFGFKMPYDNYLGGATLFPCDMFEMINGYSNKMWGYGAEDDLIYKRLKEFGYPICYRWIRYNSLPHERKIDHVLRMDNVQILNSPTDPYDGFMSTQFELVDIKDDKNYTHVRVKL